MSEKNLVDSEARNKLKDMAEAIDFAMMATGLNSAPAHVVPMSTKKVDDEGSIWFLSGRDSDHNRHINAGNDVQLIYSDPGSFQFLTVYGKATIETDAATLKKLYGTSDDMWFEGISDPNLTAIKVDPVEAHYWAPKSNKLVTLFKMGMSLASGEQPDVGQTGELKV